MVAKIFDPLYYEGIDEYNSVNPVAYDADGDYSREATAYIELQDSLEAKKCTPTFYGSWTVAIETPTRYGNMEKREVRLILMEHLKGTLMADIENPRELDEILRTRIMRKVVESHDAILNARVSHCDLAPRNIFLNEKWEEGDCNLKIFDFNVSFLLRYKCDHLQRLERLGRQKYGNKRINPICEYWHTLEHFVAYDWFESVEDMHAWLWRTFKDVDNYVPVFRRGDDPEERPRPEGWEELCRRARNPSQDPEKAEEKISSKI
jgi:hypothetical protein